MPHKQVRFVLTLLVSLLATFASWFAPATVAAEKKAVPAGPRTTKVVEYLSYPPLFADRAGTLDPKEVAKVCWKGWLSKRGLPWGTLPDGTPTIRLSFDCRALPWPSIKQHSVDGPDNNMRSLAAHALLHAMFPKEKLGDPIEAGQVGYLLFCTDPTTGLPYSPDSMYRSCAIGHGEFAKNLVLMRQCTGVEWYQDWAAVALKTLRRYSIVEKSADGLTKAWYPAGMIQPGAEPIREAADRTMGGWQHLALGWNAWAFAKWFELTGDQQALDFAVALTNSLIHSSDASGNDGSFRADGSFGGNSQECVASWHMHGHTHCLPGLILVGEQQIDRGRADEGRQLIRQAAKSFDWLYDPEHNPDAGSWTGWLGEWLMVATGWDRQTDCEGCTMGDVVETAVALGAASRIDNEFADYVRYYDRAEQIFRGHCIEQMFTLRDDYRTVLKDCLRKQIAKERLEKQTADAKASTSEESVVTSDPDQELERRLKTAMSTAECMVGQQLGACGFPDWVNKLPSDLNPDLPGIHMQGCCADATVRAAYAIWHETVTGDTKEARVNLAFNRKSDLVDVVSCLPHRGEIDVFVNDARRVLVRVPQWAPREEVRAYLDKQNIPVDWQDSYIVFSDVTSGQQLTVTYPLRVAEITETPGGLDGTTYTETWRGDTIVDIRPPGKWIPLYLRPELNTEEVP